MFESILNQFGIDTASTPAILPEGGERSGFIGPMWKTYAYSLMAQYSPESLRAYNATVDKSEAITPLFVRQAGEGSDWYRYYFPADEIGFETAKRAKNEMRIEYGPQMVFYVEMAVNDIINIADKSRFRNPVVSAECPVVTLRSAKYAVAYQGIVLPSAVCAIANLLKPELGISDELKFDVSELYDLGDNVTDEFYHRVWGNPDIKDDFRNGLLWSQRATLWSALGEPDPDKYQLMEVDTRMSTVSEKLNECLRFLMYPWKNRIWARLVIAYNPRPDAVRDGKDRDGNPRRYRDTVPVIEKLYRSEADAWADYEDAIVVAPPLPEAWRGLESEFSQTLKEYWQGIGQSPTAPQLLKIAKDLDVDRQTVEVWAKHLGLMK